MALQLQKGKRQPIKIPYHLPYLIPPWIFSHPVWMPTCFQSCLLSCSVIYTNVTVSPPFTLYWGSSLAVFHVVRILSGGGKNTCLLYASLRQDLHGKAPVTHFSFFCAPQLARSRFFNMNAEAGGEKKCLNSDIVGSKPGIENANLCCRRPGFMKDSLLSPDPHKARVKIRDCFICYTQSQRNMYWNVPQSLLDWPQ